MITSVWRACPSCLNVEKSVPVERLIGTFLSTLLLFAGNSMPLSRRNVVVAALTL
jgi:hypothetical protein